MEGCSGGVVRWTRPWSPGGLFPLNSPLQAPFPFCVRAGHPPRRMGFNLRQASEPLGLLLCGLPRWCAPAAGTSEEGRGDRELKTLALLKTKRMTPAFNQFRAEAGELHLVLHRQSPVLGLCWDFRGIFNCPFCKRPRQPGQEMLGLVQAGPVGRRPDPGAQGGDLAFINGAPLSAVPSGMRDRPSWSPKPGEPQFLGPWLAPPSTLTGGRLQKWGCTFKF